MNENDEQHKKLSIEYYTRYTRQSPTAPLPHPKQLCKDQQVWITDGEQKNQH